MASDKIEEDSNIEPINNHCNLAGSSFQATQDIPNLSRVIPTQNSQVATNAGERNAEVEQPVPARPRRILNFIKPRAPSARIL